MAGNNLMFQTLFKKGIEQSIKTNGRRCLSNTFNWEPQEQETHTGQKWTKDDYRLVRFIDKKKLVNPNWAINLIAEVPPIPVKGSVTFCDGGSGAKGHPKVYINVDKPGYHPCLYCGLRFYKDKCPPQ